MHLSIGRRCSESFNSNLPLTKLNIFRVWLKWIFGFFSQLRRKNRRGHEEFSVSSDKMLTCTQHLSINNYTWLWWLKLFDGRLISSKLITTMKTSVFSSLVENLFWCVRLEPQMKLFGDFAKSLPSSCRRLGTWLKISGFIFSQRDKWEVKTWVVSSTVYEKWPRL